MAGDRQPDALAAQDADAWLCRQRKDQRDGAAETQRATAAASDWTPQQLSTLDRPLGRGPLGVAAQDAELVALRVGQDDPARTVGAATIGYAPGTETSDAHDLLVSRSARRQQVEMKTVLDRLRLRNFDEQQAMTSGRVNDHTFVIARFVRVVGHSCSRGSPSTTATGHRRLGSRR